MNGQLPRRLVIKELDNRDTDETWIWLCPTGPGRPTFVSVDPVDLFTNMLENASDEEANKAIERVLAFLA